MTLPAYQREAGDIPERRPPCPALDQGPSANWTPSGKVLREEEFEEILGFTTSYVAGITMENHRLRWSEISSRARPHKRRFI